MDLPQLRLQIFQLRQQIAALQAELTGLEQEEQVRSQEELHRAVDILNHIYRLSDQVDLKTRSVLQAPIWQVKDSTAQLGQPIERLNRKPQYRLRSQTWLPEFETALTQLNLTEEERHQILNSIQVLSNMAIISDPLTLHILATVQ